MDLADILLSKPKVRTKCCNLMHQLCCINFKSVFSLVLLLFSIVNVNGFQLNAVIQLNGVDGVNLSDTFMPNDAISNIILTDKRNVLMLLGDGFNKDDEFVSTFSLHDCKETGLPLTVVWYNNTEILVQYDSDSIFGADNNQETEAYLCLVKNHGANGKNKFIHLGITSKFERLSHLMSRRSNDDQMNKPTSSNNDSKLSNNDIVEVTTITTAAIPESTPPVHPVVEEDLNKNSFLALPVIQFDSVKIIGIRIESSDKGPEFDNDGTPIFEGGTSATFRLFGSGFTSETVITLTSEEQASGGSCLRAITEPATVIVDSQHSTTALVTIKLPLQNINLYMCAKNDPNPFSPSDAIHAVPFVHQGSEPWLRLRAQEPLLPIWLTILIIFLCLCFSALFSGLNLGLMSMDRTELKILMNAGTDRERKYAAQIFPVREHGNYLLCSILLGDVLVNSTFTILLDGLTSGLIAVLTSTIFIVLFGEITPQAICSRHGLAVGAKTIWITKAVMVLTAPLSYPTSKVLDWILGKEIGAVYNRDRLKELVKVTTDVNDLDKDEVNIISGALELRKKTVSDVMTHIEDVFMLSLDAILDFETISEIMKSGFSRIPIYEKDRTNIVTLLYIKDLAFVDPDDNTQLKTLCEFYQNPCHFVFEDVTLDVMFRQFKEGHHGHMAFVHRVNNEGDGDPFYETIGLITLEDVIEELIQAEIMDETDVFTDNRNKLKRIRPNKQDFTIFAERRDTHRIRISPQLTLATFQYLSTSIDSFKPDVVSETILRRLLNQDIVHHIKCKGKEKDDPAILIYEQGKAVDYFVLILEGRVEVCVGKERLRFESGPFTFFGVQALAQNIGVESPIQPGGSLVSLSMDALLRHTFVPDYSVRAVTEVVYIAIKRTLYLAAKRATLMERAQRSGDIAGVEPIDDEVEKLLHSLDEDDRSIDGHTKNLSNQTPRTSKPPSKSSSPNLHAEPNQSSIKPDDSAAGDGPYNEQTKGITYQGLLKSEDEEEVNIDTPLIQKKN